MPWFGLGFQEIVVIAILALVLLGPKKLPELAQTLGKFVRDFQRAADDVKRELTTPVEKIKREFAKTIADQEKGPPPPVLPKPDPSAEAYGLTADTVEKPPAPEAPAVPGESKDDTPGSKDPGTSTLAG